jgi:hypothetical protein
MDVPFDASVDVTDARNVVHDYFDNSVGDRHD